LLPPAAHRDRLGHPADLEQPRADDPVGQLPQGELPLQIRREGDSPGLAGDGRRRRLLAVDTAVGPLRVRNRNWFPGGEIAAISRLPDKQCRRTARDALGVVRSAGDRRQLAAVGAGLPSHPDHHDLAEQGSGQGHLRANALGHVGGHSGQPLLNRLPGGGDVRPPAELDDHTGQPESGLAADIFYPVGPEQGGLLGIGDERLDLLGGQPGALGQDGDPRPVERREHVDRQGGGRVPAVHERGQAEDHDERPVAKGETDDGVEHDKSLWLFPHAGLGEPPASAGG
jgi:hypothetical protein